MRKTISLKNANLLYLISMLLVLVLGSIVQTLSLTWGLLATEFGLILLPTILFLRAKKVPLKEGLRLRKIKPLVGLIALLIGVTTYLFSLLIEGFMAQLSGMPSVNIPQSMLPNSTAQYVLYIIALAISAPICEEALFRGAIQGGYESQKSAAFAITLPALMFAIFHFRFSGLPGLLPVAFLLGYLAWRSQSIVTSMLLHLGINGAAAAVTVLALNNITLISNPQIMFWISIGGLVATLGLLLWFIRVQPKPEPQIVDEQPHSGWFARYWPLLVAGVLYLGVAVITFFPQLIGKAASTADLHYYPPQLVAPIESSYQITNRGDEVVGEMVCLLTPHGETFAVHCTESVEAFELKIDRSFYADGGHQSTLDVVWQSTSFKLLEYHYINQYAGGGEFKADLTEGDLTVQQDGQTQTLSVEGEALLEYEWLWKVNNLDGTGGPAFKTPYVYLSMWDEKAGSSSPQQEVERITLIGDEALTLPAGDFDAWKVTLGSQSAWYGHEDAFYPRPLKFDNGMLTYSLLP